MRKDTPVDHDTFMCIKRRVQRWPLRLLYSSDHGTSARTYVDPEGNDWTIQTGDYEPSVIFSPTATYVYY